MDEIRLLNAIKKGDTGAFDTVFEKYASYVFLFAVGLTKNKIEAEEVLQETFVKVWENRKTIDAGRNFRNYLVSIAKNLIYDILRRKVVEKKYLSSKLLASSNSPTVENDLHMNDLRNLLLISFNKLTPHQKEILTLKSQGLSNDEIAGALNLSKRTVEGHLSRSYKELRTDLQMDVHDIMPLVLLLIICLL